MGFNRRYGNQPRWIPEWAKTVGACRRNRVLVKTVCGSCRVYRVAKLKLIERKMGAEFSLFDRHPRCSTPGCDGRVSFIYSAGKSTPMRPMKTTP